MMAKIKTITDGVFTEIVGSPENVSAYDQFLNRSNHLKESPPLKSYTQIYKDLITKHKVTFEMMADLEEIIMQMRAIENIGEVKLSLVRQYVYARAKFFRKGKSTDDIRVIAYVEDGEKKLALKDLEEFASNPAFIKRCKAYLKDAMSSEVKNKIQEFERKYGIDL